MVDYLYTGNYETKSKDSDSSGQCEVVPELVLHTKMFSLADKYLMDGLLALSASKFKQAIRDERNTCTFIQCIPEVYDLQFDSSRILCDIVVESMRERIANPPLKANVQKSLDGVLDEAPEFAGDLVRSFVQRPMLGHCSNCSSYQIVPIASLQRKCEKCGKGGASPLGTWYEG